MIHIWDFIFKHYKFQFYSIICLIALLLPSRQVFAAQDCGTTIPNDLRLEKLTNGTGYTQYEDIFIGVDKEDPLFEQLFKLHVAKFNNISGSIIRFKSASKEVYRSAILSENIALLSELIKERNVKTIIVLTSSKLFDTSSWIDKERTIFAALGGEHFIHILDFDSHFDMKDRKEVERNNSIITSIIKLIANSSGNVLIHCLGGEHKTEMVFEAMQKCINKVNNDNIVQRYKCHTGWVNSENKGGYRANNINFILDFPCNRIDGM
jgi:phosphotransferase system IIB component